ncbi:MAG: LexA family transcriptional regulator [Alphaproteobacteria bacterium]|nr:LexA family transcriptional regulator [Alphaproteobacteria bacterium]
MDQPKTQGERLAFARKRAGFRSASAAARALGVPEVTFRAHENGLRGLTEATARSYGQAFRVNWAWLVTGDGSMEPPAGAPPVPELPRPPRADGDLARLVPGERLYGEADLPVYGTAEGGPTGMIIAYDPIEWVKRPEPLRQVENGFGFYLVGDSMSPRFEHGDLLLVHPTRPPGRKDDVLAILRGEKDGEHYALVKRFVGWKGDQLLLEQLNPAERLKPIQRAQIAGLHMIVGSYRGLR